MVEHCLIREESLLRSMLMLRIFEEIKENDFNLNIPRYVDTFEEEEEIDVFEVQKEIEELEKELVEVRGKMVEKLKEIGA